MKNELGEYTKTISGGGNKEMLPPHVAKAAETLKASKVILDDMYKHKQEYSAVDLSWRCLDILRVLNSTMISLVEEDLEDEDQMPDEEEKEKMPVEGPVEGDDRLTPKEKEFLDPKSEEKEDQFLEDFSEDSVETVDEPDEEKEPPSDDVPERHYDPGDQDVPEVEQPTEEDRDVPEIEQHTEEDQDDDDFLEEDDESIEERE
ncbi:hypothetical protein LCGC14_0616810 [marine sediment metagenome]|uniref:Uncharacterized protein n=1 Tax=marine sediment metagenome TaxID=412755 RepID=A0A0F9RAV5_9ZZZZ